MCEGCRAEPHLIVGPADQRKLPKGEPNLFASKCVTQSITIPFVGVKQCFERRGTHGVRIWSRPIRRLPASVLIEFEHAALEGSKHAREDIAFGEATEMLVRRLVL